MIPANELRIGNMVLGASRGGIEVVTGRMIAQLEAVKFVVHPIPLTPEILEKCGFEFITDWTIKENDGVAYRKDLGWLRFETGMMSNNIVTLMDKKGISTGVNLEYLHQLQNLYFDLTGEELPIQL